MSAILTPLPPSLEEASQALHQVVLRLGHYAKNQGQQSLATTPCEAATQAHLKDLQALLMAVERYEQAKLASLAPAPLNVLNLTPAQLLAYRESDPVYRLGWVRGHKAGVAQAQRATAPALSAYAQHATLPAPTIAPPADFAALVKQVRRFLATLQQRRNDSQIILHPSSPSTYAAI